VDVSGDIIDYGQTGAGDQNTDFTAVNGNVSLTASGAVGIDADTDGTPAANVNDAIDVSISGTGGLSVDTDTVDAGGSLDGGEINIFSQQDVTLGAASSTFDADGADVFIASTGAIAIAGNVNLSDETTAGVGDLFLLADQDNAGGEGISRTAGTLTATDLTLSTGGAGSIGAAAAQIETDVVSLTVDLTTTGGDVYVNEADDLTLNGVTASNTGTVVSVIAANDLTVADGATVSGNDIRLAATAGAFIATGGTIGSAATTDITIDGDTVTLGNNLTATPTIDLNITAGTAASDIEITAQAAMTVNGDANVSANATAGNGNVSLIADDAGLGGVLQLNGVVASGDVITARGQDISLGPAANLSFNSQLNVIASTTSTMDIVVNATVPATTGVITITNQGAGAAAGIDVQSSALINAGTLVLNTTDGGDIT